jgi:PLP dependent protein
MAVNQQQYETIKAACNNKNVTLVAVSKLKPKSDIMDLYHLGQRDFGENYVQELLAKYEALPKDIRWHFIGHLQTNKVKYIAPFVHLIHGIESEKLLAEVDKQGKKNNKKIPCLLQVHIAQEETKFGLTHDELDAIDIKKYSHAQVNGLMGMASFSNNEQQVVAEFEWLNKLYNKHQAAFEQPNILSMGMSGDYKWAILAGSNMVRIGSLLFGARG